MAKKIEIEVTIDEDGTEHVEAKGFEGPSCSTELGKFLTGKVVKETKKPEYYKTKKATVKETR